MAKTTSIRASVKMSPKIRDVYYSIEYMEERQIQETDNIEEERAKLFDDVYNEVAEQINQIIEG